jgi:hypothetical protein
MAAILFFQALQLQAAEKVATQTDLLGVQVVRVDFLVIQQQQVVQQVQAVKVMQVVVMLATQVIHSQQAVVVVQVHLVEMLLQTQTLEMVELV